MNFSSIFLATEASDRQLTQSNLFINFGDHRPMKQYILPDLSLTHFTFDSQAWVFHILIRVIRGMQVTALI